MVDLDKIKQLVEKYYSLKEEGKLKNYNEEATKKGFIEPLLRALDWDIENLNEVSVEETISKKRVDYGFRVDGIPKFFLEAKALREDDIMQLKYVQQAIDYAWMKSCTWAILTNFRTLVVYNAEQKSSDPRMNRFLIFIEPKDYLEKIDELMLLSKESIKNGELDRKAEYVGKKELKKSIDKALLDDITNFREIMYNNIKINNKNRNLSDEDIEEAVQRIIDRMIFIRNAEDRGLEPEELRSKVREWSSSETGHLLNQLNKIYSSFDKDYDSRLFEYNLCDDLKIDDNILEEVINGLYESRDGLYRYDFSLISADILGNIYEQYLGRILKKVGKTSKLEASKAKRKSEGIYYTPTYIVDYIVKNTVGEYIKTHKEKDIENVKILDPACGSGSFLLKAYDTLENYWKEKGKLDQTKLEDSGSYSKKVEIVTKNIFGVDLDEKAVEIAQLNLLLKIAEKRKRLPTLQKNIKNGNSLIDDPKIAGDKAFKWEDEFSDIMKKGGFDVVIGNPPYDVIYSNSNPEEYKFYKSKSGYISAEYNPNLFTLFIERGISLLRDGGILGFIVPNSIINNKYFCNLRKLILEKTIISQIYDLKKDVFKSANIDTCIIIIQKELNEQVRLNNKLTFYSGDADATGLEIKDKREITQKSFLKTNFYSFNVVTDLKFDKIKEKIEKDSIKLGEIAEVYRGMVTRDNKECIFDVQKNEKYKPLLSGRDIGRYWLKFNNKYIYFDKSSIGGGCWDEKVYLNKQKLLVQLIRNLKLSRRLLVAYDDEKYYALQNLNNIIIDENTGYPTKYVLGIINSSLINYWFKKLFVDINIKRIYLKQIPIKIASETQKQALIKLVDKMLSLNKRLNEIGDKKTDERTRIEEDLQKTDTEIDELVYKLYGITEEEKKIIEESLK